MCCCGCVVLLIVGLICDILSFGLRGLFALSDSVCVSCSGWVFIDTRFDASRSVRFGCFELCLHLLLLRDLFLLLI